MPSVGFSAIFEKALELAETKWSGLPGIDSIGQELRRRAGSDSRREQFIDPSAIAQAIHVPTDSVEAVADELLKCGVLHHWASFHCPNQGDEYSVVFETDDPDVLRERLNEPCRFCGQIHSEADLGDVEFTYAINVQDKPEREFDLVSFF